MAQGHQARSGIGFKLGPQLADQRAAGHSYGAVPGGVIGAYMPLWVANRLELQTELLGSMQGFRSSAGEKGTIITNSYYVQMPVNFMYYFGNEFNLQVGGYAARLLAARTDGASSTAAYAPWDLGFTMGLGLHKIHGFDLSLRYVYGMTDLMRNSDGTFPTTRCLQLTAGWRIVRFGQH